MRESVATWSSWRSAPWSPPLTDRAAAPKQGDEGAPEAWLVFDERVADALDGIAAGDELLVLTWLDRAERDVLRVHPRGDPANPEQGVFNTRSPDRPNPVGLHRVTVISIDGLRLRVRDLEALRRHADHRRQTAAREHRRALNHRSRAAAPSAKSAPAPRTAAGLAALAAARLGRWRHPLVTGRCARPPAARIDAEAVAAKARELAVMGWVRPTGEIHAEGAPDAVEALDGVPR